MKASSTAAHGSAPFVVMPETVQIRNASTERCDMAQGPCACGAWHARTDWAEPIIEAIRAPNNALNAPPPTEAMSELFTVPADSPHSLDVARQRLERAQEEYDAAELTGDHYVKFEASIELHNASRCLELLEQIEIQRRKG